RSILPLNSAAVSDMSVALILVWPLKWLRCKLPSKVKLLWERRSCGCSAAVGHCSCSLCSCNWCGRVGCTRSTVALTDAVSGPDASACNCKAVKSPDTSNCSCCPLSSPFVSCICNLACNGYECSVVSFALACTLNCEWSASNCNRSSCRFCHCSEKCNAFNCCTVSCCFSVKSVSVKRSTNRLRGKLKSASSGG